VLKARVWRRLLGLSGVKIEAIALTDGELVVRVALHRPQRQRCGICRKPCGRYDRSRTRRRWRGLDLGTTRMFIEAEVVRVSCPEHGVVVERVPWAVHDSRFTRAFEEQLAWLTVECSKSAVAQLMRVSWRTVGRILERVAARIPEFRRRWSGLRRIGIDEISFRKGHRYLTGRRPPERTPALGGRGPG
jgi:transposase